MMNSRRTDQERMLELIKPCAAVVGPHQAESPGDPRSGGPSAVGQAPEAYTSEVGQRHEGYGSQQNPKGPLERIVTHRWVNIGWRTAHLAAMGVLVGGHVYGIERERLLVALWWTIGTGVALSLAESGPHLLWFHQWRGLFTMGKVVLLCAVPFYWDHRIAILIAVVIIGSVGSHMPARFRYYSVLERRPIRYGTGPGVNREL